MEFIFKKGKNKALNTRKKSGCKKILRDVPIYDDTKK